MLCGRLKIQFLVMNHPVVQFRKFGIVPTVGGTYQVAGDALQLVDVFASAFRASFQVGS